MYFMFLESGCVHERGLLARVCDLFAKVFVHLCGGLPDLTLWNPADIIILQGVGYLQSVKTF